MSNTSGSRRSQLPVLEFWLVQCYFSECLRVSLAWGLYVCIAGTSLSAGITMNMIHVALSIEYVIPYRALTK
ncbi:hypothetical protein DAEQUDRAFT_725270 [Daedalea quercina L-15889]|uniref:Uncharacterized protein n=1 Tax=Daedalea quercina L-15889 TaxID=1314783 RepID=A0A165R719_9APHY|nr:hypothetical protein DAEQUDRAFT_725270 [Daedalea quercina L-15889]